MNRSNENLCQMSNSVHDKPQLPSFRRRQNPLYEEKVIDDKSGGKTKGPFSETCILCSLVVVGVLAIAALILVILDLSGVIGKRSYSADTFILHSDNSTEISLMTQRLQDMERKYSDLEKFVKLLNQSANNKLIDFKNASDGNEAQKFAVLESLLSQNGFNVTRMENRLQQFEIEMATFNKSMQQQLSNIKKMPGPQGPPGIQGPKGDPGAGNLTRCKSRELSRGTSLSSPDTDTAWTPNAEELRDWVITGLECSTVGGNQALLQVRQHPDNAAESQFMCRCHGVDSAASSSRYCKIHIFECPRIS